MPHILIVEDDTDINNSTAEYLRRKGCLCSQAFSGTEGWLLWQAGGVDLLLVDLMLPGLSGSELIREIRRSSRTPVIVLSAKTELSDKVELHRQRPEHLFDRFYQSNPARAKGGAGLGLSIVRELMERMGGQVSAQIAGDILEIKLSFRGA